MNSWLIGCRYDATWWMCLLSSALVTGCADPGSRNEVVAYVAVDRKDAEPILKQFESRTGIRVRAVYDAEAAKTTGLVTRLIVESKRPRCDVFWNNEVVQSISLAERGLLQSYRAADWQATPAAYRDVDHRWTGVATRARVIVYNTRLLSAADVPRKLDELTSPKWRGKLAVANPMFGTTRTHIAALYAAWGPAKAEAWLRQLLDNGTQIVDGNAMVMNLVARADPNASPVLVGLTDTDDVLSGQADGLPVDFVYPDQNGLGTLVIPTTVCLVAKAPHPQAGKQLVDYLLEKATESRLTASGTGYRPIRASSDAPEGTSPQTMDVTYDAIHAQLAPSTEWVSLHFHH